MHISTPGETAASLPCARKQTTHYPTIYTSGCLQFTTPLNHQVLLDLSWDGLCLACYLPIIYHNPIKLPILSTILIIIIVVITIIITITTTIIIINNNNNYNYIYIYWIMCSIHIYIYQDVYIVDRKTQSFCSGKPTTDTPSFFVTAAELLRGRAVAPPRTQRVQGRCRWAPPRPW